MLLKRTIHFAFSATLFGLFFCGCNRTPATENSNTTFQLIKDETEGTISVFRRDTKKPLVTQNAKVGMRPYLHPIMAPDGNGSLTEYSPDHHKHQTGLYWGFTRVNGTGAPQDTLKKWFYDRNKPLHIKKQIGRDFFHFNGEDHWKRISAKVVTAKGEEVAWQTVYHMLDAGGDPILEETMNWSLREKAGKLLIALEWRGKAIEDITINEFDYGGMFLRMPWRKGIKGEVVNNAKQRNQQAEGQKAMWVDAGMEIEGRNDWGHIAILDHPQNAAYPTPWRVDGQLGIGPARSINGDWHIQKGATEVIRHQIVAYTGDYSEIDMEEIWREYTGDQSSYVTEALGGECISDL